MAYLPLSTANLPDPAIDPAQGSSPEDYFNTLAYDGTGVNPTTHTGVGFQPDFVWMHPRSRADNHNLFNVLSGAGQRLNSNNTSAETFTTHFISFDSDGFTTTADSGYNQSGQTYVAWNWKANGSGVSNTDGLTPSTVSANTESGFSIVSYTGSTNESVGHGLDQAPECILVKNRDASSAWAVYHQGVQDVTANGFLELNQPYAVQTGSNPRFLSGTAGTSQPTSTVFYVNNYSGSTTNNTGNDYIAYCFHSVEGFSKFGSYEGTNNADGPFIYLGFRPKFFLLKNVDSALQWIIFDGERDPYNVVGKRIFPNLSNAESAVPSNSAMDFLSNGVKIKVAGGYDINDTGTYIYMAFAENPFKYSNAR